jgi:hypothetical protein
MTTPLSFDDLQGILHRHIEPLPDSRKKGPNTRYRIPDAALGAFGIFFTQSPSFLEYQRRLQQTKGQNNTHTLLGVEQRHWFSVMGMAKCRRLAGKPSACGYIIIDSIHPQMRSMPWNCYRSSAQHATLLSCNLIRRIPPSIMVAVSFTNVRTVLPTFLRQKRLSWQA